jgi:hypothetical protein
MIQPLSGPINKIGVGWQWNFPPIAFNDRGSNQCRYGRIIFGGFATKEVVEFRRDIEIDLACHGNSFVLQP